MSSRVKRQADGAFFKSPREFKKRGPSGLPIGPRTERRQAENQDLNKLKISRCEVRIEGVCIDNKLLTWAHSKKSRYLVTKADWQEAARCCLPCHMELEKMSHKQMHRIILAAIKRRNRNVSMGNKS